MALLEFLLAAALDPVQAALVLVVVLAYRGPWPIPAAAVAAALASETVMTLAPVDYVWGELLAPRLVSSLVQAALLYSIVRLLWPGRTRPQPGAEAKADRPSRLAPWHMRALVRRRFAKLR
jgi:hypothetical protein